jgi:hypothetical protein
MAGEGMDESYSPISVDVKRVAEWGLVRDEIAFETHLIPAKSLP